MNGAYERISSIYTKTLSEFIGKCLTVNQKKRPSTKELLCLPVMLELTDNLDFLAKCEEDPLMGTIKFPPNLKCLNFSLPAPKYDKPVTSKLIYDETMKQDTGKSMGCLPSMKNVKSEKYIGCGSNKKIASKKLIQASLAINTPSQQHFV